MTPGTIIVLIVLATIVSSVIFSMRKSKKAGKSSCGCACEGCPSAGMCHKQ